jgi:DNA-binding transcriptional regulator PaaX
MIHFEMLQQPSERIGKTRLKNAGEIDEERGRQPSATTGAVIGMQCSLQGRRRRRRRRKRVPEKTRKKYNQKWNAVLKIM